MHDTPPNGHGLLAPITPSCPAGSDLRNNDLFLHARDMRNAARDSERQRTQGNACDPTRLQAQWSQIAMLCCDIITSHSKDLDVCAWLIEAWARLHGLRGIANGFTLYRELITRYWDCLHPPADINDVAARVSALNALNGGNRAGTLVEALHYLFVTGCFATGGADDALDDDSIAFTLWQYRAAIDAQRLSDDEKRQRRIATLGFSLQQIRHAADNTATASYQAQLADCDAAQHALRQLDDALAQTLGVESPSTALIHTTLDEMRDALAHLTGRRIAPGCGAVSHNREIIIPIDTGQTADIVPLLAPSIRQRHEAIAQLGEVAGYFRIMEPHSPLASAIERLMRWANMPCDELMRELIPDRNARDVLWLMTGIAADSQSHTNSC